MKAKTLFSLLSFLLFTHLLRGQVAPFFEPIDSNTTPAGWTTYNDQGLTGSNSFWKFASSPAYDAAACFDHTRQPGSHFAWVDGSVPFANNIKVSLETDSIDVSNINELWLDFALFSYNVTYDSLGYNRFTVDFYDGNVWHDSLFSYQGSSMQPHWQYVTLNLSIYPAFGQVKLRFNVTKLGTAPYFNDIAIDDIFVRDSCAAPQQMVADTIGPNFIGFFAINSVDSVCTIEYGSSGFAPGTGTIVPNINNRDTLTGLQSNTLYDFYLTNSCDTLRTGPYTFRTGCFGPFGGDYTVGGPNADFPTLNKAFEDLSICGLSDSVNLYLQGGSHQLQYAISAFPGHQMGYWVSIIGSGFGGDTITPVGNREYLMNLRFARNLLVKNLYFDLTGSPEIGIWIYQHSNNIIIDSCIVDAQAGNDIAFFASNQKYYLAYGNNVENLTIKNCLVRGSQSTFQNSSAIAVIGPLSSNGVAKGVHIYDNVFNRTQITVRQMDSVTVRRNTVKTFGDTPLFLGECEFIDVQLNHLVGDGYGNVAMSVRNASAPANNDPSIIKNNFIVSKTEKGLAIRNSSRIQVVHNSIYGYLNGTELTDGNRITFKNNITYSETRSAIQMSGYTPSSILEVDHNVYFENGYYPLASWGTTDYNSLAAWQADMPTFNANSLEGDPEFYGIEDLHTHSIICNNKADSTGILIDIDGDVRPSSGTNNADIGADEYDLLSQDLRMNRLLLATTACGDSATPIHAVVKNSGTDTLFSYAVSVAAFGGATGFITTTVIDTLLADGIDTVLVGTMNTANAFGSVDYQAYVFLQQDQFRGNDTLVAENYLYKPQSAESLPMDSVCANTSEAMFLAKSNPLVVNEWYQSITDTIPYAIGDAVILPITQQQTWFLGHAESNRDSIATDDVFGQSTNPHGIMFNIHAQKDITIDMIRVHTPYTFSIDTIPFKLYYIANDVYQNNDTIAGAWTLNDSLNLITYGFPWPIFNISINPITIQKGESYAFYLDYAASQTQTSRVPFNNDLVLEMGVGLDSPFGQIEPKIEFNGAIFYTTQPCAYSRVPVTATISSDSTIAAFTYNVDTIGVNFTFDASSSNGDLFQWFLGDGSARSGKIIQHTYGTPGQYTVCLVVRDTNCVGRDSTCALVSTTIGMPKLELTNEYRLYPNPTSGMVRFIFSRAKARTIRLYSMQGQLLKQIHSTGEKAEMYISFKPGVYIVEIDQGEVRATTRVVKL
jgi:hypothetical protein